MQWDRTTSAIFYDSSGSKSVKRQGTSLVSRGRGGPGCSGSPIVEGLSEADKPSVLGSA